MRKSISLLLSLASLINVTLVASAKFNPKIYKRSTSGGQASAALGASGGAEDDVGNINNIRYTTEITLNGKEIIVLIDTGSSDLWVSPDEDLGDINKTEIELELVYGDGVVISGEIATALFEFGPYTIPHQAFLKAEVADIDGLLEHGVHGVFGLGFNDPNSSAISKAIAEHYPDVDWSHSVLYNIFAEHPTQPNFIGITLDRSEDLEDVENGSFTIGEYDIDYEEIQNAPMLYQYPPYSGRWTTLMDGIIVNGHAIALNSTIPNTPPGKTVTLIDSGTSGALLPEAVVDALYSHIPGALKVDGQYFVPCNASFDLQVVFAGISYTIHPLDLSNLQYPISFGGREYTVCTSAVHAQDSHGGFDFDMILGTLLFKNIYGVLDFGDNYGNNTLPFMQFHSITDPFEAAVEHNIIRQQTLSTLPPTLTPREVVELLGLTPDGHPPYTSATPSDGDDGIEDEDGDDYDQNSTSGGTGGALTGHLANNTHINNNVAASGSGSKIDQSENSESTLGGSTLSGWDKWGPAVIGLLAANLIVVLALLIFAVLGFIRRGGRGGTRSRSAHIEAYAPVSNDNKDEPTPGYGSYQAPYGH